MKKNKICIIDDNEAVCDAIKFLFESCCELQVKIYHDPLLFLEELSPDWDGCLLIDLFMQSMNGIHLTKKIKEINNNVHIIIMSGHGTANVATQAIEAGANAFITKPFNTEYLLEMITNILEVKTRNLDESKIVN